MRIVLSSSSKRIVEIVPKKTAPLIIASDAMQGLGHVQGACLIYDPDRPNARWGHYFVFDAEVLDTRGFPELLVPDDRRNAISQAECLAAACAHLHVSGLAAHRGIAHFVDNTSALLCLARGQQLRQHRPLLQPGPHTRQQEPVLHMA